jgi:hypothetical protein
MIRNRDINFFTVQLVLIKQGTADIKEKSNKKTGYGVQGLGRLIKQSS